MNTYTRRVRDNILPLSVGNTLPAAFEEWSFADNTEDHGEPIETCQLCNKEELRYRFEIKNAITEKHLWVGSQCIHRFNLSVFESGIRLSPDKAKKKLHRLTLKMHLDSCINSLRELVNIENNDILSNALKFYIKNKYFTPKYAFVVFWKLNANNIRYNPRFFKIKLDKKQYKKDLREMELNRVHIIWPAFSAAQRKQAIAIGHTAPV